MTELMSPTAFKWFITLLTGVVAGAWLVYDAINLVRIRTRDAADPIVRDKRFGYLMGIVIGAVGLIGCLRFHDVL